MEPRRSACNEQWVIKLLCQGLLELINLKCEGFCWITCWKGCSSCSSMLLEIRPNIALQVYCLEVLVNSGVKQKKRAPNITAGSYTHWVTKLADHLTQQNMSPHGYVDYAVRHNCLFFCLHGQLKLTLEVDISQPVVSVMLLRICRNPMKLFKSKWSHW